MQNEKHASMAVLLYLLVLLTLVVVNLITNPEIIDIIYLVVVVACVFKYFMIVHEN